MKSPSASPASGESRAARREQHDFWPGFIAALIGVILAFCGARHLTGIETVDGGTAWETQLIKAFAFGGLQYADRMAPPARRPNPEDPDATAEALERWARTRQLPRRRRGRCGWTPPPRLLALPE